ncbi:MAG: class I SAM-dependent methyltransferase [Pseudonocardiaceae bacterium]
MALNMMSDVRRTLRQLYDEEPVDYAANTDSYAGFPGRKGDVDTFAVQLEKPGLILDPGSGSGRDSKYLAARGFSIVAADFSLEMLRTGRSTEVAQVQADMVQLPFRSNVFTGAWACASLLHLPFQNHDQALIELLRVLTPGGLAAVSMKAGEGESWTEGRSIKRRRWFTLVDPAEFVSTLASTGFVKTSWSWCDRGSWFIAWGSKAE